MKTTFFTSESVTEGHPDKMCDQISDAVLDALISKDDLARVACESAVTNGLVIVTGEITSQAYVDIPKLVREVIRDIGYINLKFGFDCETCGIVTSINKQSPDIALGVDKSIEAKAGILSEDEIELIGAGDQGMMFGFACNETPELMPLPIALAHRLAKRLSDVRKSRELEYLGPDGKTQVTVEYVDGRAVRIDSVIVSSQHFSAVDRATIEKDLIEHVILKVVPPKYLDSSTKYMINPTGRFVIGGPQGDTGLTGRKIIVDTYGGYARHGGGAFSGKDPTKVDRSASYAARYVAKNIVAAKLANKCEIQLSYAIGVAKPISILVDTFGTSRIDEELILYLIQKYFDLRPGAIIRDLNLRRPIYKGVASYGHRQKGYIFAMGTNR